jgi:hypothetical protein
MIELILTFSENKWKERRLRKSWPLCLTSCMIAVLKTIVVNWSKNPSYSCRWDWFSTNNRPFSWTSWRICSSRKRVCWVSTLVVHYYRWIDRKQNDMRHRWDIFLLDFIYQSLKLINTFVQFDILIFEKWHTFIKLTDLCLVNINRLMSKLFFLEEIPIYFT